MPEESYQERTESATPRKRQESRDKGNVAKSMDLNSALILLGAVLALEISGPRLVGGLMTVMQELLGGMGSLEIGIQDPGAIFGRLIWMMLSILLPFLIVVFVVALASSMLQVGVLFTAKPLTPSFEKLNPISGLQRIFSIRGLMKLVLGLMKLSVVATVVFLTIWFDRHNLLGLSRLPFEGGVAYFASIVFTVSIRAAIALLFLALLDFGYQRWQHEKDMRMSKQEVKEEMKRYEGDPKIRERRRAVQRQLALQRMMTKVPQATVVVTNPTELSVALRFEKGQDAPEVVAKGAGHLALRIRQVAMEHGVTIVQRKEVARALYRTTEVGQQIPVELYEAVAEIIAYVYRLRGETVAA